MTINSFHKKLRQQNKGQYSLLSFCIFLSVFLVSAFSYMYFGQTVQDFLPEGGDTRKLASLLLAVTMIGCSIFTAYASTLFFRYKSREYGIFLALGESRRSLKRILFRELASVTLSASISGIILGLPASWLIWKVFETFLISNEETSYRFGVAGLLSGIGFAVILALILSLMGRRFVNRSDIIDILKASQKTEMVKEIKPWVLPVGILLVILGILLGLGLNSFAVTVFHRSFPGASLYYLLALAGIYLILLSVVSQSRLGRNKEKFYQNMVSVSLMRFVAKSTARNMCVIVLLLFACMFSAFYGLLYSNISGVTNLTNSCGFAMHYPSEEDQISKEDIDRTAAKYQMEIVGYGKETAANLVISYKTRDYDNGKYITVDAAESKLALFFSSAAYHTLTGQNVSVASGTYQAVTPTDYKENIWDFMDGLYEIKNPDTGKALSLTFGGALEYDALYNMSHPYAYVLNDADYAAISEGLSSMYTEQVCLFDVADLDHSYSFAKDLLNQYIAHATGLSNHYGNYDMWEEQLAGKQKEDYVYAGELDYSGSVIQLLGNWKYSPQFVIITRQDYMQMICVYVMLCLYIFIITLSAVAVMNYVRSISIAENNKLLFQNLEKLGANTGYRRKILKKQLARIYQYPTILGCLTGLLFSLGMCVINDRRLTISEIQSLCIMLGISAFIMVFQYLLYCRAKNQAEKIVGII